MGFGSFACESSWTGLRFETPIGQLRVDADLKLAQWMFVGGIRVRSILCHCHKHGCWRSEGGGRTRSDGRR